MANRPICVVSKKCPLTILNRTKFSGGKHFSNLSSISSSKTLWPSSDNGTTRLGQPTKRIFEDFWNKVRIKNTVLASKISASLLAGKWSIQFFSIFEGRDFRSENKLKMSKIKKIAFVLRNYVKSSKKVNPRFQIKKNYSYM